MREGYWGGSTWVLHSQTSTNNAGGGNILYVITPGAGQEMEILYGTLRNTDTAARTHNALIRDDGDNTLYRLIPVDFSATNEEEISFPVVDEVASDGAGKANRLIVSGGMDVALQGVSYAQNQELLVGLVCRIRGPDKPTVSASVSAGVASTTENTNKVF